MIPPREAQTFDTRPAPGIALPVAPGVRWLRMPLPFALDHVNLWLLEEADGVCAVDTGIALDSVQQAWRTVLAEYRLTRQIVTHFHPDHLGLAAWLEAETGAPLWITQGEYLMGQAVAAGLPPFDVSTMIGFYRRHGLDEAGCQSLEQRGNAYKRAAPAIPATFRRLMEGEVLRIGAHDWRVIVGFGHAPEHASLYCAELGVLISGDMLLPRISTNVSAHAAGPAVDVLALYLASLDRLTALPADTLVLPSHGQPFRGLHARIEALHAHHAARCEDLLAACAGQARTAAELLTVLFGRPINDPHQIMFAMGEAIAHLIHLENRQENQRRIERIEENGIVRHRSLCTTNRME